MMRARKKCAGAQFARVRKSQALSSQYTQGFFAAQFARVRKLQVRL